MLLLQEFDLEIKDKIGAANLEVDHLSIIERDEDPTPIQDYFPDEQLLQLLHHAYWAVKSCMIEMEKTGLERKLQLHQLEKLTLEAYDNSQIINEKNKHFHDKMISMKEFSIDQKVLLFNFHLKIMAGKLRYKWIDPFVVTNTYPHDAVEIKSGNIDKVFKVNGQHLKLFHESSVLEGAAIKQLSFENPTYTAV
ncbi:uncharacterized protein [Cicer arietinum]|uniref:Uncharacterized protein LOC101508444 n=1 Tax=Cicer arietinum TaxID=3827 RepID=A0A1S2Z6K5_CICAR|nr:uncharacterized protein LOC101508444 [Cicer arietinum]